MKGWSVRGGVLLPFGFFPVDPPTHIAKTTAKSKIYLFPNVFSYFVPFHFGHNITFVTKMM